MTTAGTSEIVLDPLKYSTPIQEGNVQVVTSPNLPSYTYLILHVGRSWTDSARETWMLKETMPVKVSVLPERVEAVTVGAVSEAFGAGASVDEALFDLLTLLSDTLRSLEQREDRLGSPSLLELEELRKLIRHQD